MIFFSNSSNIQSLLADENGGGSDVEDVEADVLSSAVTLGGDVM
jgi:hypothetical protein